MKTITEAQEKNHTVPIDLFPRTSLGQLMRRAVMYTYQAGADGTNAPHPSKKKLLVTFGSPHVHIHCHCCATAAIFVAAKPNMQPQTKYNKQLLIVI